MRAVGAMGADRAGQQAGAEHSSCEQHGGGGGAVWQYAGAAPSWVLWLGASWGTSISIAARWPGSTGVVAVGVAAGSSTARVVSAWGVEVLAGRGGTRRVSLGGMVQQQCTHGWAAPHRQASQYNG